MSVFRTWCARAEVLCAWFSLLLSVLSTMPGSGFASSFSVSWLEAWGPLLHGSQRCLRTIRHSLPGLPCVPGKTFPFIKRSLGNIFSGPLQHQLSNHAMKLMFPARLWMLCSNSQESWVLTRYSTTMPLRTTIFLQQNMPEYQTTHAENRLSSNSGKIKCK